MFTEEDVKFYLAELALALRHLLNQYSSRLHNSLFLREKEQAERNAELRPTDTGTLFYRIQRGEWPFTNEVLAAVPRFRTTDPGLDGEKLCVYINVFKLVTLKKIIGQVHILTSMVVLGEV